MAEGRLTKVWRALTGSNNTPDTTPAPRMRANHYTGGTYRTIGTSYYDGEKNLGEAGPIKHYWPDYEGLRLRSWQAFLESEIAQTVFEKFNLWVIGSGLKLQAEPVKRVLQGEGIELDSEEFNESVESRFGVFAKSVQCDYSGMRNLHMIAHDVFKNSIIGGDVLVILRLVKGQVKVQIIDGAHVCSPMYGSDFYGQALNNGNVIRHGIELSPSGQHVAYYVRKEQENFMRGFETERIPARSASSGLCTAFLVYGLRYRLDNHRGLPIIAAILETIKKMERYKEATVGSAEEVAKIAWQVVHEVFSTGENPLAKNLAKAFNADASDDDIPEDIQGKQLADTVAATTNKTAVNNPPGAEIKAIASSNKELYFKDFYTVMIDLVCAAINIPPEVAMSRYNSNFSASRAALKDWENTLLVRRNNFAFQFYQKIYDFFLDVEILMNKIQAPGYLMARSVGNAMVLNSYRNARFVGAPVPHIDPLKEVNAERAKLGAAGKDIPLTTVEAATEALNGGDSDQNMLQYADELQQSRELGIQSEDVMDESEDDDPDK